VRHTENVALVGFMGSGKSSVGRLVAQRLDFRFVDTDRIVVQSTRRQITEIFQEEDESFFREQERLALESLQDKQHLVIATGGGIVTRAENVALLRQTAFVVWLTVSEEVIFERVSRTNKRPLLQTANPRETISTLLAQRRPLYQSAAHLTVETSTRSHAEIAEEIIVAARGFFAREQPSASA
jgi:shikimate kinase